MKNISRVIPVAIALALCGGMVQADLAAAQRETVKKYSDAVVTVQLVLEMKTSYEGESEKEQDKANATATVIDPGGMVVTSLVDIDPMAMESYFADKMEGMSLSCDVVDLKIKTSDGEEIPADVVLRDKDLGLAFIRPKTPPATPMAYVDLSDAATPEILDDLVVLARMNSIANRTIGACVEQVHAVVSKPRTFYVISGELGRGGPAFGADGKPAGIVVSRIAQGKISGRDASDVMGLNVVLPSKTVFDSAQLAKAAQPEKPAVVKPEPKPAAKPAPKPAAKPAPAKPSK